MKQLRTATKFRSILSFFILLLVQSLAFGQDSTTTTHTTTTTSSESWYTSPWVWVIGAALFILLLVALLRGKSDNSGTSRTDKITVTKRTDSDV